MPLTLTCPECNGKLKVADNIMGKKIKCPKCAAVFPARAPEEAAVTAAPPPPAPKSITKAPPPVEEPEEEELPRARKKARDIRRDPAEEAVSTLIPYKNGRALAAYYLGVFSLIPCLGLLLGPAGLIFGILGLRYAKAHPTAKGGGHAIAGIILGGLTTLFNWGVILAAVVMGGIGALGWGSTKMAGGPVAIMSNNAAPQGGNPDNVLPQEINLGQPLFAADRNLVDPNQRLIILAEPGRVAALRAGLRIQALAFSPDGKTLAIANQADVKLWNLDRGQARTIPARAQSLAFSADGTRLAVGSANATRAVIELYNTQTLASEKTLFEGPQNQFPQRMLFSPNGSLFAAGTGPTLQVWETATWQRRPQTVEERGRAPILGFAFDRDTKTLAVALKSGLVLLDAATLTERSRLKGPPVGTAALAWSTDGKMLVADSSFGGLDLWDVNQGKFVRHLQTPSARSHSLAFAPDDKTVIVGTVSSWSIMVYDVASGRQLSNRTADAYGSLTAFAVSPDRQTLVSGNVGGIVKLWNLSQLRGPGR